MKRRILCVLLSAVLLCGIVLIAPSAAASEMSTSDKCIQMLKEMEGFAKYPYWDYLHWTVGYGTRCPDEDLERYRQNGITEAEADALLRAAVSSFDKSINTFGDKYSLNLSQNQFDALLLFCYNLGNGWMFSESNFRSAVINGATGNDFIIAIARWCNAGGKVMPTLVKRRLMEANMYLNGIYDKNPPKNYCYVLYDAQGGKTDETIQAYDSVLTSKPVATATYEGYSFDGWYTAAQGGTRVTVLDGSVGTRTLYAHWRTGEESPDPEPTEPKPTEPKPTEPKPTEPKPTEPKPTEPKPTEPVPAVPAPTEPPTQDPAEAREGTVTGQDLRIRKGPGTSYGVVGYLNKGDRVTITEQKTVGSMVWGKISKGWISMNYVKLDAPTDNGGNEGGGSDGGSVGEPSQSWAGIVTTNDLRVRSGPGTSYSILGYLNTGDRVTITEQKTSGSMTWGKTAKGWICMSYVKLEAAETPSGSVMGTVNVSDILRIRKGPGTSYTIVGYLNPKTQVEILEQKNVNGTLWGRIEKGWISMDYVVLNSGAEDKPAPQTRTVIADLLYIRSNPGTSNSIVGYLYNGARVEILEQTTVNGTPWGKVSKGWICMNYVK